MTEHANHAIVFGASGLIGWALVEQLLSSYPNAGTFSRVTAVTNRPLHASEAFWPEPTPDHPVLQLVSGIDLGAGDGNALANSLKQAVKDIATVTHIYYLAFTARDDDVEEVAVNCGMLRNVIDAHSLLCPDLQFIGFAGGTRGYGIYIPGGTFTPPLTEDMVNNLPPDYAKTVVYPAYRKLLSESSKGKQWTWCEVCPDTIVGFTPGGSQFSLALHWAQYLSLYAFNHNVGSYTTGADKGSVEVPFPGNAAGASSLFSPVSSKTLARFMIYASLHPDSCGSGRLFNVADNATPTKYGDIWPQLASWFGLKGTMPIHEHQDAQALGVRELPEDTSFSTPGDYVAEYRGIFEECGHAKAARGGVGAGSRQLDSVGYWLTFDRQMSLDRLREVGFDNDKDPVQGWLESFEIFRKAKLIL